MNFSDMKFESRLVRPVSITDASVQFDIDGQGMIADCPDPIHIGVEKPIEVWECECGKHPCVSFQTELSDGTPALITGNLPEGAMTIRFAPKPVPPSEF